MATFQRIPLAGNMTYQYPYKIKITGQDCSDLPELTAWDDYNMTTTAVETLDGTGGGTSAIAAISTHAGVPSAGWAATAYGSPTAGAAAANVLKGTANYVQLGATAPTAGDELPFNLAMGIRSTDGAGTTGHTPVLAVKIYHVTPTPPGVEMYYNSTSSDTNGGAETWVQLNLTAKGNDGTGTSLPKTVSAAGPDSTGATESTLDPITRPDAGITWAPNYYAQTVA